MQKIIVIGGGASGMAAAVAAARYGAQVTILEQNKMLGKKILSTGNGRCNLTNLNLKSECYRGDHPEFIQKVIAEFGVEEVRDFFAELSIFTKCRGEYVYPLSDQAASVREAFVMELKDLKVQVVTECFVERIEKKGSKFLVFSDDNQTCRKADRVILAAGGRASEISGSDGSGYGLAKKLGHSLSPVVPALVQLRARDASFKKLAGIRIEAGVQLFIDGLPRAKDQGEVQLTDYGVSGIPVFQISRYAAKALREKKEVQVKIDFAPHLSEEELLQELIRRRKRREKRKADEALNTLFPAKLIPVLLEKADIMRTLWAEKVSEEDWRRFVRVCKAFIVDISEANPFSKAQICAGGVKTDEIRPDTMESRICPGLYITGELLDVDGICGGYNLHFAWASGTLAGAGAAGKENL